MRILNKDVIDIALRKGFNLVGFTRAELLSEETKKLDVWLSRGYHSGMKYMERNREKRNDVKLILENAKSVISLAINYYVPEDYEDTKNAGKVSRYAWSKDYHLVIWEKLADIISELEEFDPEFKSRSYVDTGPVMDKDWAVRAGVGWMGKHTNVINPQLGSWFFVANIICNYEFDYSEIIPDHCGTCTACIDNCPTDAIVEEYVLDSNKCISYLTIENKKEIPGEFKDKFENWIFGCDICQDVCPWNVKFSTTTRVKEFRVIENKRLDIDEMLTLTNKQFNKKFATSAINRARLKGIKRNAKFIEP